MPATMCSSSIAATFLGARITRFGQRSPCNWHKRTAAQRCVSVLQLQRKTSTVLCSIRLQLAQGLMFCYRVRASAAGLLANVNVQVKYLKPLPDKTFERRS
jgi:hypothetical protein